MCRFYTNLFLSLFKQNFRLFTSKVDQPQVIAACPIAAANSCKCSLCFVWGFIHTYVHRNPESPAGICNLPLNAHINKVLPFSSSEEWIESRKEQVRDSKVLTSFGFRVSQSTHDSKCAKRQWGESNKALLSITWLVPDSKIPTTHFGNLPTRAPDSGISAYFTRWHY